MNNDLKNVILQTLEEVDKNEDFITAEEETSIDSKNIALNDRDFLLSLKERLLVLFEGLQSPNVVELDKKVDLIINFLELTLSNIEKKLNG